MGAKRIKKETPDQPDMDEMARKIEELVTNPPLEVIERMDRRLKELRRPQRQNQPPHCIWHTRCG